MSAERKPKRLCEHDIQEILMFQRFLSDRATMTDAQLYRKYQKYCELSDEEVIAIERRLKP